MFDISCGRPPGLAAFHRPTDVDVALLAGIVEHLTGQPYEAFAQRAVLRPLGVQLTPSAPTGVGQADGGTGAGSNGVVPGEGAGAWVTSYAAVPEPQAGAGADGGGGGGQQGGAMRRPGASSFRRTAPPPR